MAADEENFASETEELRFLRFFYHNARRSMGPADGDICDMIAEAFTDVTEIVVPEHYYPERERCV